LHEYKFFKLKCKECGSEDVYLTQESIYIIMVCNNHGCNKEEKVLEISE